MFKLLSDGGIIQSNHLIQYLLLSYDLRWAFTRSHLYTKLPLHSYARMDFLLHQSIAMAKSRRLIWWFLQHTSRNFCFISLKSDGNYDIGVWLTFWSSMLSLSRHINLVTCDNLLLECNAKHIVLVYKKRKVISLLETQNMLFTHWSHISSKTEVEVIKYSGNYWYASLTNVWCTVWNQFIQPWYCKLAKNTTVFNRQQEHIIKN